MMYFIFLAYVSGGVALMICGGTLMKMSYTYQAKLSSLLLALFGLVLCFIGIELIEPEFIQKFFSIS